MFHCNAFYRRLPVLFYRVMFPCSFNSLRIILLSCMVYYSYMVLPCKCSTAIKFNWMEWMSGWMEGQASVCAAASQGHKITNPGMTLQMYICTRPCVCLTDLVAIRIPDTVSARMLQMKASGRKLNCQTDGEGGRSDRLLC